MFFQNWQLFLLIVDKTLNKMFHANTSDLYLYVGMFV